MTPQLGYRAVLYSHDMEPITVLQLTDTAYNYLTFYGQVTLAVMEPVQPFVRDAPPTQSFRKVHITAELLRKGDKKHLMLFTHDEESAMLLQSAFLPGQQRVVQEREAAAFGRGFLFALGKLGSGAV